MLALTLPARGDAALLGQLRQADLVVLGTYTARAPMGISGGAGFVHVTLMLKGLLGFGPRLWSVRRGECTYGVKAIPAGAYVRITGMTNLDEVDPAEEHRTYRAQSYPRRLAVALAGSATHFGMSLL